MTEHPADIDRGVLNASLVLNAHSSAFSVGSRLRRFSGRSLSGPALCVRLVAGDNLALHQAIARAPAGHVLVAAVAPALPAGYFGEIMATACVRRGIAGLIIDGTIRDVDELVSLGFPVFARGIALENTTKAHLAVDPAGSVDLAEGRVHDGDLVVADGSGVVVLPSAAMTQGLERASQNYQHELTILDRVHAGETTLSALGLER